MIELKLYLMVLSILLLSRYLIEFLIKLFDEEPSVMKINTYDRLLIYLSSSYIITYLIIT